MGACSIKGKETRSDLEGAVKANISFDEARRQNGSGTNVLFIFSGPSEPPVACFIALPLLLFLLLPRTPFERITPAFPHTHTHTHKHTSQTVDTNRNRTHTQKKNKPKGKQYRYPSKQNTKCQCVRTHTQGYRTTHGICTKRMDRDPRGDK